MSTVAGVFTSRRDAEHALNRLALTGLHKDSLVLLTPEWMEARTRETPSLSAAEQPGMGAAMGGVVGGAAGVAGGVHLGSLATASAAIPGVGPVIAFGLLGGAILGLAGARMGKSLEDMATGLPADEFFVYEDALRKGRSLVIAFPDENITKSVQQVMRDEGAESIDAARKQWWIGLRTAEKEHYSVPGRTFAQDEEFYRMGFEEALHARHRCKEYDQVHSELESRLEDFQQRHPDGSAEAFRQGFQRGLEYYQQLCQERPKQQPGR